MNEVTTIGLDIAKNVFQAHGADSRGQQIFSRRITRGKVLEFFADQPRCLVALEAFGGAHHWARELTRIGHDVRLIPPAYVKPFVKRQKNDAGTVRISVCGRAVAHHRKKVRFFATVDLVNALEQEKGDCQDFRVRAGIMGKKESHYVPTQGAGDPG